MLRIIFGAFYRLGQPHLLELSQKACCLPQVSLLLQEGVAAKAVFKLERSFEPASKRAEKEKREARPMRWDGMGWAGQGLTARACSFAPVPLPHVLISCCLGYMCEWRWASVAWRGPNIKMNLKLKYDKFAGQEAGGAQRVWGGMRAWRLEVPVRFPFLTMASTSPFCLVERAC